MPQASTRISVRVRVSESRCSDYGYEHNQVGSSIQAATFLSHAQARLCSRIHPYSHHACLSAYCPAVAPEAGSRLHLPGSDKTDSHQTNTFHPQVKRLLKILLHRPNRQVKTSTIMADNLPRPPPAALPQLPIQLIKEQPSSQPDTTSRQP